MTPILKVKQRVLLKKTEFEVQFFDGYAIVNYSHEKTAKESYKNMKKNRQKCNLKGNEITEYFRGKKAKQILDMYIRDVEKAMKQNGKVMNVQYELINKEVQNEKIPR